MHFFQKGWNKDQNKFSLAPDIWELCQLPARAKIYFSKKAGTDNPGKWFQKEYWFEQEFSLKLTEKTNKIA